MVFCSNFEELAPADRATRDIRQFGTHYRRNRTDRFPTLRRRQGVEILGNWGIWWQVRMRHNLLRIPSTASRDTCCRPGFRLRYSIWTRSSTTTLGPALAYFGVFPVVASSARNSHGLSANPSPLVVHPRLGRQPRFTTKFRPFRWLAFHRLAHVAQSNRLPPAFAPFLLDRVDLFFQQ